MQTAVLGSVPVLHRPIRLALQPSEVPTHMLLSAESHCAKEGRCHLGWREETEAVRFGHANPPRFGRANPPKSYLAVPRGFERQLEFGETESVDDR